MSALFRHSPGSGSTGQSWRCRQNPEHICASENIFKNYNFLKIQKESQSVQKLKNTLLVFFFRMINTIYFLSI